VNNYWIRFKLKLPDFKGFPGVVVCDAHLVAQTHKEALGKLDRKLRDKCFGKWNLPFGYKQCWVEADILESKPVSGPTMEEVSLDEEYWNLVPHLFSSCHGWGPIWTYVNDKEYAVSLKVTAEVDVKDVEIVAEDQNIARKMKW